jgi:integrase
MKLPRYTQSRSNASGVVEYRFNPPQTLVDAGVVKRELYGSDIAQVRVLAKASNMKIDAWRDEQAKIITITGSSTVKQLIDYYYQSNDFKMLRETSKEDYIYFLSVANMSLGNKKYSLITPKFAKQTYEEWVERGISFANHVCTCMSKVYNYAMDMEQAVRNPWANIKRKKPVQRKVVWSKDNVVSFLDVAYSSFDYRSVGLIIQMAYEWCQRIGDMRTLVWDNINLAEGKLYLEQSKRRAEVFLPISLELNQMLQEQHSTWNFQQYVAPIPKPVGGEYLPYSMMQLSKVGRVVMNKADLPTTLRLMDLRRTGVVEMIDAGVPLPQVMSVTGHTNPASVKPYMKNTYTSANNALTLRKSSVQSNLRETK